MKNIHLIYFSPSLSTRKIIRKIGKEMGTKIKEHDVTMGFPDTLNIESHDLVIFGIPVYAGRVPQLAVKAFEKIKGDKTPAVLVCVYGNRNYDDALLELKDISVANGFVPIAAGAFIARHSIFSDVAVGRPDKEDKQEIQKFAQECFRLYQSYNKNKQYSLPDVKGNYPYREPTQGGYVPTGDDRCDDCGTCVSQCPTSAIPRSNPKVTNMDLCIRCARCITLCPEHSRAFRGELYETVKTKFAPLMAVRKEPEVYMCKI